MNPRYAGTRCITNRKLFINQNTLGSNNVAANLFCKHQRCRFLWPKNGVYKVYAPRHYLTLVCSSLSHFLSISNKKFFINQNTLGSNSAAAHKLCKHQRCMFLWPTNVVYKAFVPRHYLTLVCSTL